MQQANKQYKWFYTGLDSSGKIITGVVYASSAIIVKLSLRKEQLSSLEIRRYNIWLKFKLKFADLFGRKFSTTRVKTTDKSNDLLMVDKLYRVNTAKNKYAGLKSPVSNSQITLLIKQFLLVIKSGMPLLRAFDIVIKGQENKKLDKILSDIKVNVENGLSLSEAFGLYPKVFDPLLINFLAIGEKGGILEVLLQKYIDYQDKSAWLWRKIKAALTYPAIVFVVSIAVLAIVLGFVVPQFSAIFAGFGAILPAPTLMVVGLSNLIINYWLLLFVLVFSVGMLLRIGYFRFKQFRLFIDQLIFRLPLFGGLMRKNMLIKFSRTLALLFGAGITLNEALRFNVKLVNNYFYAIKLIEMQRKIEGGSSLTAAISNSNVFGYMVNQMVAVGEETGSLETSLHAIASYYEQELEITIDALLSLIEPVTIITLGGLLGAIIIALYLPLFNLGNVIG